MTADPARDLFLAILSLDAYNRGYDRGVIYADPGQGLREPEAA